MAIIMMTAAVVRQKNKGGVFSIALAGGVAPLIVGGVVTNGEGNGTIIPGVK